MKTDKRRLCASLVSCMVFLLLCGAAGAGEIGLRADLPSSPGDFYIEVYLRKTGNLRGVAFDLVYDTASFSVADADGNASNGIQPVMEELGVLSREGQDLVLLASALENDLDGRVVAGLSRAGRIGMVNVLGEEGVARIRMILLKETPEVPVLDNVYAQDGQGSPIDLAIIPTLFYEVPPVTMWMLR